MDTKANSHRYPETNNHINSKKKRERERETIRKYSQSNRDLSNAQVDREAG